MQQSQEDAMWMRSAFGRNVTDAWDDVTGTKDDVTDTYIEQTDRGRDSVAVSDGAKRN